MAHARELLWSAVSGLMVGACANEKPPSTLTVVELSSGSPADPSPTARLGRRVAVGDPNCCKGKNECKGQGNCASASGEGCRGLNECKGKGGCRPEICPKDRTEPNCCKGQNLCKGIGGCKTEQHDCRGKNECKALGGCAVGRCRE